MSSKDIPYAPSVYAGDPCGITSSGRVNLALTVSDVERLAKAGVQLTWEGLVVPDPPKETTASLTHMILQRWARRQKAMSHLTYGDNFDAHSPFLATPWADLYAMAGGQDLNKIFVVVLMSDAAEPIIIPDSADLFPSDMLMGSLILLSQGTTK